MSRTSLGVVIRSFNEEHHIGRLLTGIDHQTLRPDQIVLVDSGSSDATVEIATRFGVVIKTIAPSDFSFGRSLNLGCAGLDTDLIVIVSAHVYPIYDTWLESLVAPLRYNDKIALSYGRQVGDERTKFSEHQLMRRWYPETSVPVQVDPFCNNANAAISRALWDRYPYDESLTALEDLEWAGRVIAEGYRLSYVADSPVVHVHEESWSRLRNRYRREAIAHRRLYEEQSMGALEALALGVKHTFADYAVATRQRVLLRNLLTIPSFQSAQFLGAYEGFAHEGDIPTQLKRHFYYPVRENPMANRGKAAGRPIDYSAQGELHAPH